MKTLTRILTSLLLALPLAGAEIIIPVAGVTPGANNSFWRSDVTLHNAGTATTTVAMKFIERGNVIGTNEVEIGPKQTRSFENVAGDLLGLDDWLGAIVLETDELSAKKLTVTSRTYTTGPNGQLGQEIPAYTTAKLGREGETAVISGPSDLTTHRFNFGIYAHEDSSVEFVLYRAEGSLATSLVENFSAGTQIQYSRGVETFLGETGEPGDTVYARVLSGAVIFYGSIIARDSNDPTFVPHQVTTENFETVLLGIDYDENGSIEIADADNDGVLDQPILIQYTGFPVTVRVVVVDPEGDSVSLKLLTEASDMLLVEEDLLRFYPYVSRRGTSTTVVVEASDGFLTNEYVLPVEFK